MGGWYWCWYWVSDTGCLIRDGSNAKIHVDVPLDVAEKRDPKGLYEKARKGEIKGALLGWCRGLCFTLHRPPHVDAFRCAYYRMRILPHARAYSTPFPTPVVSAAHSLLVAPGFTGIDDPYEEPLQPEIRIENTSTAIETSVNVSLDGGMVGWVGGWWISDSPQNIIQYLSVHGFIAWKL